MRKKKTYDDDDGRTIADMSSISRQPLILPRFKKSENNVDNEAQSSDDKPWENTSFSKKERRSYIFGALGAAVLVGSIFAISFLILILLMIFVWK